MLVRQSKCITRLEVKEEREREKLIFYFYEIGDGRKIDISAHIRAGVKGHALDLPAQLRSLLGRFSHCCGRIAGRATLNDLTQLLGRLLAHRATTPPRRDILLYLGTGRAYGMASILFQLFISLKWQDRETAQQNRQATAWHVVRYKETTWTATSSSSQASAAAAAAVIALAHRERTTIPYCLVWRGSSRISETLTNSRVSLCRHAFGMDQFLKLCHHCGTLFLPELFRVISSNVHFLYQPILVLTL